MLEMTKSLWQSENGYVHLEDDVQTKDGTGFP